MGRFPPPSCWRRLAGQRQGFPQSHQTGGWWGQNSPLSSRPSGPAQRRGPRRAGDLTGCMDRPPLPPPGACSMSFVKERDQNVARLLPEPHGNTGSCHLRDSDCRRSHTQFARARQTSPARRPEVTLGPAHTRPNFRLQAWARAGAQGASRAVPHASLHAARKKWRTPLQRHPQPQPQLQPRPQQPRPHWGSWIKSR